MLTWIDNMLTWIENMLTWVDNMLTWVDNMLPWDGLKIGFQNFALVWVSMIYLGKPQVKDRDLLLLVDRLI